MTSMLERVARALFLREMQPFIDNGSATVTTFEECMVEFPEVAPTNEPLEEGVL